MNLKIFITSAFYSTLESTVPNFLGEESNFPRKIGTGMPHILGFLERGYRKVGVPIFL